MATNDQGAYRYKTITLYFEKTSKEEMAIYQFLTFSPRKKSNFIMRLITKFLHDNGVVDIGKITREEAEYLMKIPIYSTNVNFSAAKTGTSMRENHVFGNLEQPSGSSEELLRLLAALITSNGNTNGSVKPPLSQQQFDNSSEHDEIRLSKKRGGFKKQKTNRSSENTILSEDLKPTSDYEDIANASANSEDVEDNDGLEFDDMEDSLISNWREGLNSFSN